MSYRLVAHPTQTCVAHVYLTAHWRATLKKDEVELQELICPTCLSMMPSQQIASPSGQSNQVTQHSAAVSLGFITHVRLHRYSSHQMAAHGAVDDAAEPY